MNFRTRTLRTVFPLALVVTAALFSGEWYMWKKAETYPAMLAQTVVLTRPSALNDNALIDGNAGEQLCHDAAPGPDVSPKANGLFVRCGSPLLRTDAIYRIKWANE